MVTKTMTVTTSRRLAGVDRVRGFAIAGMVVSHLLATFPTPAGELVRLTVLRVIAPLFVLVAGALLAERDPSRRAFVRVGLGAVVAVFVTLPLGRAPVILAVFFALLAVWPIVRRYPLVVPLLAVVWVMNAALFPVPTWTYHPGGMLLAMCLGAWAGRERVASFGDRLPGWCGLIGRWPLSFYLGHLAMLSALVWFGLGQRWDGGGV